MTMPYGGQPKNSRVDITDVPVSVMTDMETLVRVKGQLTVDFFFDPHDALAITFHVKNPSEDGVVNWTVSRDAFVAATKNVKPDYIGDANMFTHGAYFFIDLSSPYGNARLRFARAVINTFILRTLISVPQGQEVDMDELDRELHVILEQGL